LQVSELLVSLKLQQLLKRTADKRTSSQALQRLGVSLKQLADMVNQKELGGLTVDLCCSCGSLLKGCAYVACEHCVVGSPCLC
jgi:hypothetical protein